MDNQVKIQENGYPIIKKIFIFIFIFVLFYCIFFIIYITVDSDNIDVSGGAFFVGFGNYIYYTNADNQGDSTLPGFDSWPLTNIDVNSFEVINKKCGIIKDKYAYYKIKEEKREMNKDLAVCFDCGLNYNVVANKIKPLKLKFLNWFLPLAPCKFFN